jgi:hypothetical protein
LPDSNANSDAGHSRRHTSTHATTDGNVDLRSITEAIGKMQLNIEQLMSVSKHQHVSKPSPNIIQKSSYASVLRQKQIAMSSASVYLSTQPAIATENMDIHSSIVNDEKFIGSIRGHIGHFSFSNFLKCMSDSSPKIKIKKAYKKQNGIIIVHFMTQVDLDRVINEWKSNCLGEDITATFVSIADLEKLNKSVKDHSIIMKNVATHFVQNELLNTILEQYPSCKGVTY